jgi:dipeptidase D
MSAISGLEPRLFFEYFEAISRIPRGSGNMDAISSYVLQEAQSLGYKARRDEMNNVVVFAPATEGYENAPAVMLQGHMDMVCEKTPDSMHDFKKDPLKLILDGDHLHADRTTLGGDDGAAVCFMLMILKDKSLPHPALECVFTTDEETGMFGAAALDCSDLRAKRLINLDNELENEFVVACAGGARFEADVPVTRHKVTLPAFKLTVTTEKGGHSGVYIHKNRPNANLVLAKWLGYLNNEGVNFSLVSMDGGMMDNAIPMMSSAVIMTDLEVDFLLFQEVFDEMFRDSDDHPHLSVECLGKKTLRAVGAEDKYNLLNALCTLPNGVQAFMEDMPELVKTSLNFGILKTLDDKILCRSSVRSSDEGEKEALLQKLTALYKEIPGTVTSISGNYPGWAYVRDSELRKRMVETYDRCYAPESGRKAKAEAIHAGLECGLLLSKMPGLDIVSTGPDMEDIHTPKERLSVKSVDRFCRFVLQVLREMKE